MNAADRQARDDAVALARSVALFWQERLGDAALGFYLVGSLAHGGFNRRYSDIDVALISTGGIGDADLAAMRAHASSIAPALAPKLSVFWTDRAFAIGRFPPLDRLDYLDHAVAIFERDRVQPPRPSVDEVRTYLRGTPFENWRAAVERFAAMEVLEAADHKPCLRAHLYPARFAYSWQTGRMASNDEAVAHLREQPPDGLDISLLEKALKCRHEAADPDVLFAERKKLPGQHAACHRLMNG